MAILFFLLELFHNFLNFISLIYLSPTPFIRVTELFPIMKNSFGLLLSLLCCLLPFTTIAQKKYEVEKLNTGINSGAYDEITPVASLDGNTLYFTRVGYPDYVKSLVEDGVEMSIKLGPSDFNAYLANIYTRMGKRRISDPSRSEFNQDIWIAQSLNGTFDQVTHPGPPLNNAMPNSVSSVTPSSNELVVINKFSEDGGMKKGFSIVRDLGNGDWTFPEPIGIENYYNTGSDVNMTMSSDGRTMILSLKTYDSKGKNDLYISFKKGESSWSQPKNLGSMINSAARETTPYLSEDNKTLFFSSSRRSSASGNDIFMCRREGEGWDKWTQPQRLIEPINSDQDDSQPFFNSATGYLYFASRRDGSSDIFRVKIAPAVPRFVTVKGRIIDPSTNKKIDARILSGAKDDDSYRNVYVADDGTFRLSVPKGMDFTIMAEKPGYIGKEEVVNYRRDYVYFKEKVIDLELVKIEEGVKLDLPMVYFKQSTATVKSNSFVVLDELADFMRQHYNVRIRIEGHTDNQGDPDALMRLSEDRAKAIKNYLVGTKRINPLRIATHGFGAAKPFTKNDSEANREKNRRVEVIISQVHEIEPDLHSDNDKTQKE